MSLTVPVVDLLACELSMDSRFSRCLLPQPEDFVLSHFQGPTRDSSVAWFGAYALFVLGDRPQNARGGGVRHCGPLRRRRGGLPVVVRRVPWLGPRVAAVLEVAGRRVGWGPDRNCGPQCHMFVVCESGWPRDCGALCPRGWVQRRIHAAADGVSHAPGGALAAETAAARRTMRTMTCASMVVVVATEGTAPISSEVRASMQDISARMK